DAAQVALANRTTVSTFDLVCPALMYGRKKKCPGTGPGAFTKADQPLSRVNTGPIAGAHTHTEYTARRRRAEGIGSSLKIEDTKAPTGCQWSRNGEGRATSVVTPDCHQRRVNPVKTR